MVYLFVGDDTQEKLSKINSLKKQFFPKDTVDFNYDSLDSQDLDLIILKESLKKLPLKVKKRLIVIKNCQKLSSKLRDFILDYVKNHSKEIVLILDFYKIEEKDNFFTSLSKYAKLIRFKEFRPDNGFDLEKAIREKNSLRAINILNSLLLEGQKPEQILGLLRYQYIRNSRHEEDLKNKLNLILEADINIKTTRLKPEYALEVLVLKLCQ